MPAPLRSLAASGGVTERVVRNTLVGTTARSSATRRYIGPDAVEAWSASLAGRLARTCPASRYAVARAAASRCERAAFPFRFYSLAEYHPTWVATNNEGLAFAGPS